MVGLLTAGIIANQTKIPETTVRRYLLTFEDFFFSKKIGRATKYDSSSVALIKKINDLYNEGYTTADIRAQLSEDTAYSPSVVADGGSVEIEPIEGNSLALTQLLSEFNAMKQQLTNQSAEIQALKEVVDQNDGMQKDAISKLQDSINDRDLKLMETIRVMQDKQEKQEKKSFWKRLFE